MDYMTHKTAAELTLRGGASGPFSYKWMGERFTVCSDNRDMQHWDGLPVQMPAKFFSVRFDVWNAVYVGADLMADLGAGPVQVWRVW